MFRWGFVGSVGISCTVAKQLIKEKDQSITAVYSKTYKHCEAFAQKFGAKAFMNYEDMLDSGLVDAIYVATPHAYHYYYSKVALEKGIPVLCEKPLTLNKEAAEELFRLAEEKNVYFAEAMWTWFNPTAIKVKEWVDNNKVGKPLSFSGDFSVPSMYLGRKKRLVDPSLGGGSLFDLGVYPVTYAYRLFGYPDKIEAKATMKGGIDTKCNVKFIYNSGVICNLTCSFLKLGLCNAAVLGEDGKISIFTPMHDSKHARLRGKQNEDFFDKNMNGYANELVLVSKEIQEGLINSKFVSREDSINVMKIMDEIKTIIGLEYPRGC